MIFYQSLKVVFENGGVYGEPLQLYNEVSIYQKLYAS